MLSYYCASLFIIYLSRFFLQFIVCNHVYLPNFYCHLLQLKLVLWVLIVRLQNSTAPLVYAIRELEFYLWCSIFYVSLLYMVYLMWYSQENYTGITINFLMESQTIVVGEQIFGLTLGVVAKYSAQQDHIVRPPPKKLIAVVGTTSYLRSPIIMLQSAARFCWR